MAVKVNFKMAAAAILDFAGIEFCQQNGLWSMVFSPCVNFVQIYAIATEIAIKPIFKMAAAAILNLLPSLFLAHRRNGYLCPCKTFKSNSTGG